MPLSPLKYKGKEYPLSHGYYGVYMHQGERGLRKKAFTEYYNAYLKMINTISSTYFGNVKKNVFYAKARKYKSVLDMMLDDEDVSPIVYKNLINGVNKSLPILHKYMSVKNLHLYHYLTSKLNNSNWEVRIYDESDGHVVVVENKSEKFGFFHYFI